MLKHTVFAAILIALGFAASASAQCVSTPSDPCVSVNQSLINQAGAVADKLRAAQDVIAKFAAERSTSDAERAAAKVLIASFNDLIATKDRITLEQDKIIEMYKQVVALQQQVIESLEKRLAKPKSAFSKFLTTLKEIGFILAGVAIGRGF